MAIGLFTRPPLISPQDRFDDLPVRLAANQVKQPHQKLPRIEQIHHQTAPIEKLQKPAGHQHIIQILAAFVRAEP